MIHPEQLALPPSGGSFIVQYLLSSVEGAPPWQKSAQIGCQGSPSLARRDDQTLSLAALEGSRCSQPVVVGAVSSLHPYPIFH